MIKYPFFDILAIVDEFADGGITMARTKKYSVHLSDDDVKRLKILIHKKDTSDTIFNRCRILMDLDEEHPPVLTYRACASKRGITMTTVANTAASCQRS